MRSEGLDHSLSVLPAGTGRAVPLYAGEAIEVVNQAGSQVVDTWAVTRETPSHLSVEHTRAMNGRLVPTVGDLLFSSARQAVIALEADSSPGVHDTLIPACDAERYRQLGHEGYHANCTDNFRQALEAAGTSYHVVPSPLNLFMNVPWTPDGSIRFAAPVSRPGDAVRLRALTNLVVVLSACPQDIVPVNGDLLAPQDIHYRVLAKTD